MKDASSTSAFCTQNSEDFKSVGQKWRKFLSDHFYLFCEEGHSH